MALNPPSTTVPEMFGPKPYQGQNPMDTASAAGVSQQEYTTEQTKNPQLNPDVIIGNILMQRQKAGVAVAPEKNPAPAVVTSSAAERKDQQTLADLTAATSPKPGDLSNEDYTPKTPTVESQLSDLASQSQVEYDNYLSKLDQYQSKLDSTNAALMESIKASFARQRKEVEQLNKGVLGAQTQAGIRSGRNMYAPEMESFRLGEEQKRGLDRLAEVDALEQQALAQAESAATAKDFELLDKRMSAFRQAQADKREAIIDLHNITLKNEEMAMARAKEEREIQAELDKPIIEASIEEQKSIRKWRDEHPDAGIDVFTDTAITAAEKLMSAPSWQKKQQEKQTADLQEYEFAQSQGYEGSFMDYRNLDAQQKLANQLAMNSGLTDKQVSLFKSTTDKFQADPIIKLGEKAQNSVYLADEVIVDPGNPTKQLTSLYTFIKQLDPDSVVREAEVELAGQAQSYISKWRTSIEKLGEGKILSEKTATELAKETKVLADRLIADANRKLDQYKAQASILGIGESFDEYLGLFERTYEEGDAATFNQDEYNFILESVGKEAADRYKSDPQSFSSVGADTNTGSQKTSIRVKLPSGQVREGGTASWRNNNPLNIKYGKFAQGYGAGSGSAATDGGVFAAFPSEEAGLKAARDLLRAQSYTSLPLEKAMRRWSGNGYGADVAPANLRGKTTGQMTDAELTQLINSMRQREGWREGKILA